MADVETEQEWEKSKRIEAERMKAAQALAESKPEKAGLEFLGPKKTKVKGWSNDPDVMIASAERMGNRALIFAIGGIVLSVIGYAGGMVGSGFNLGLAGAIISALPSGIGMLLMGIGVLMALVTMGVEVYHKIKAKRKLDSAFWTAVGAVGVVVVYGVVMWVLLR